MSIAMPADELGEVDALLIKNWRVNTQGSLQSRIGMTLQNASSAPVTSICRVNASSPRRYYGAAGVLYQGGAGTSATAFGGAPISMVSSC